MFGTSVEEAVTRFFKGAAHSFSLPTSVEFPCLATSTPTSQELTKNKQAAMRAWAKIHGKSVRSQNIAE